MLVSLMSRQQYRTIEKIRKTACEESDKSRIELTAYTKDEDTSHIQRRLSHIVRLKNQAIGHAKKNYISLALITIQRLKEP